MTSLQLFLMPLLLLGRIGEGGTAIGWSDLSSIVSAMTGQISVSTIVAVIAGVIGVTVGIAFMWWGARYASRKIMAALKKGRTGA